MPEYQAYTCDSVGNVYDRIPFSGFSHSTLLSAGDSGSSITVPLDGTFTKTEMRNHFRPWSRIIAIENNRKIEYLGYITAPPTYRRGSNVLDIRLSDAWAMLNRRGAWDHNATNVEEWQQDVSGSLAYQGAMAILRGRTAPAPPSADLPITLPGGYPGASVDRTYYGYHFETVSDVLSDLGDEGLDVLLKPRWATLDSQIDWLYQAGPAWSSGTSYEFFVTAEQSGISAFSESGDALRVTNNAYRVGEGSEVDMLVRSNRNLDSLYPLLDRVEMSKNVSKAAQLNAMSAQDLVLFEHPTYQQEFVVSGDHAIAAGDSVRLHFDGDPWMADGWHERRVVKTAKSVPGPNFKTITVQPTGGA
ncbi:hypothetical protein AB0E56_13025 [Microbacterium sp. NPDC028030]|uniref:hypothetical protein n=1 Tax=Microbacterium sp. NPDC028030 TaxID=3155124 RepID=UPI0034099336